MVSLNGSTESGASTDVLLARAYLSRVAEPGSLAVWDWVRREGPVDAARAIRAGTVPAEVAGVTAARRASADPYADLEAADRNGIRLVTPESPDWPHRAIGALERTARGRAATATERDRGAAVPPLALWVKGPAELGNIDARSAAIVGARSSSAYGDHVAAGLAHGLVGHGVTIISGGAYGIDAVAHRAALGGEGRTVIVSAGGLDRPYPA